MAIGLALVFVVVGSVLFHLLSPWWWTPIASNWSYIDHTISITFWITGIVFAAVVLFMAYCVFRFRHREGARAHYEPENRRLESWLTIATAVGVATMLTPGLFVWANFVTVPDEATDVEVVAQQWQWSFRLPGADGQLGRSDSRLIGPENPLGVSPDDPNGADDVIVEADDLHLPIDRPVKILLRSIDVLHDFYVPEFRAKMDMVPGMITYFWFTPTRTGDFEVLCAELCGVGHAFMRGNVQIDSEGDYQAWLSEQSTVRRAGAADASGRGRADGNEQRTLRALSCGAWRRMDGRRHAPPRRGDPAGRGPGSRALSPQELVDDLRLLAGRQDHRPAVFRHRDRHRPGRAGALLADAAAARLSRHLRLHHARGLLPVHHHARDDHGGLPADGALSRRLRQLPDPADGRRPGHGVSLRQHAQLLDLPPGGAGAGRELLRAGRPDRGGLDALPAAGDPRRHARRPAVGHPPDARLADAVHHRLHHGRAELRGDRAAGPHPRHDADAHAADGLGHLHRHGHGDCWPSPRCSSPA